MLIACGKLLLGFKFLIYPKIPISEEKITIDIEGQARKILKANHSVNNDSIDVRIELFEDLDDKRFVLYSFYNPLVGQRHAGYAVYEKVNSNFRRKEFGWNSSIFNVKFLNTKENSEEKTYLMAYGMNNANESQVYEYSNGTEKRIEEFSGKYFLKSYPFTGGQIGFTNVNGNK